MCIINIRYIFKIIKHIFLNISRQAQTKTIKNAHYCSLYDQQQLFKNFFYTSSSHNIIPPFSQKKKKKNSCCSIQLKKSCFTLKRNANFFSCTNSIMHKFSPDFSTISQFRMKSSQSGMPTAKSSSSARYLTCQVSNNTKLNLGIINVRNFRESSTDIYRFLDNRQLPFIDSLERWIAPRYVSPMELLHGNVSLALQQLRKLNELPR